MNTTRHFALAVPIALAAMLFATGCSVRTAPPETATSPQTPATQAPATQAPPAPTSSVPGTATTPTDGCFVILFDGDDFDPHDAHFTLTAPGRYENLRSLPGANQDWTDEADSIKVGPEATVTIWEKTGFTGSSQTLQPGSEHPRIHEEPSSLELVC